MIRHQFEIDGGTVHLRFTDQRAGSFALDAPSAELEARRSALLGAGDRTWIALRQVHGTHVVDPDDLPDGGDPVEADGAVTSDADVALSILTADCAPVALIGTRGVGLVHAGWRGAAGGVIERAATMLRAAGSEPIATVLGPCIQPEAYEFGAADLEPIVDALGPEVQSRTATGTRALDLTRVVQIGCERAGWPTPDRPVCTSDPRFFSHRTRADRGRQASVAWIEPR